MSDADIQLNTEGSGPRVRTLEIVQPQPVTSAGAAQADLTVNQQVITVADDSGKVQDDPNRMMGDIRSLLERNNELLELVLESLS